jgi:hypothetical protein
VNDLTKGLIAGLVFWPVAIGAGFVALGWLAERHARREEASAAHEVVAEAEAILGRRP